MDMDSQDPCKNYASEESREIKPIAKETVHRICSGQVVLSLAVAMKELVENALDAGATRVDIYLNEFGSELLEVADNGSGVHKNNFQSLTLKHYTSKIRDFSDLANIATLGFRGEALSSLCALSEVEITSKHHSADVATKIRYDYKGHIISEEIAARQQGTTVKLRNLFSTLPVRKKEFTKNLKKEFVKMCNLLYAYCLMPTGTKYTCSNTTTKGLKTTVVATEGHKTVRENIISVFGVKQLASLIDVELVKPDDKILEDYGITLMPGEELPFTFDFLISSVQHGSGRCSSDRQFYYINQRPCDPSKLIKLVNEVYRQFNGKQFPFVYLNVATTTSLVDVNITPDKRQVFLEQEKLLLAVVKASLLEAFKQFPSTFQMQNLAVSQSLITTSLGSKRGIKRNLTEGHVGNVKPTSILETFTKRTKSDDTNLSSNKKHHESVFNFSTQQIRDGKSETEKPTSILEGFKKRTTSDEANFSSSSNKTQRQSISNFTIKQIRDCENDAENPTSILEGFKKRTKSDDTNLSSNKKHHESVFNFSTQQIRDGKSETEKPTSILEGFKKRTTSDEANFSSSSNKTQRQSISNFTIKQIRDCESDAEKRLQSLVEIACRLVNEDETEHIVDIKNISEHEKESTTADEKFLDITVDGPHSSQSDKAQVPLASYFQTFRERFKSRHFKEDTEEHNKTVKFRSDIAPETNKIAEEELNRYITKTDFEQMEIIGQFNMGFIITKLGEDLFIVDQHATDEKYNFEQLQLNTVINTQKLVAPKLLELTAAAKSTLLDNEEVFKKSGFAFMREEIPDGNDKVYLTSVPISEKIIFGKADIDEMIFMLQNCPHGRPTMRHLVNLNLLVDRFTESDST